MAETIEAAAASSIGEEGWSVGFSEAWVATGTAVVEFSFGFEFRFGFGFEFRFEVEFSLAFSSESWWEAKDGR